jgi:hypothetical protein
MQAIANSAAFHSADADHDPQDLEAGPPLHGGPIIHDEKIAALQTEIRNLLEQVLPRGRRDRTIRPDITPNDIIITGAMRAQPLRHAPDWDQLARRQATIFIAGLAATEPPRYVSRRTRA